jgi:hypothetical protein
VNLLGTHTSAGARQERVVRGVARDERISGDLAAVVDGEAAAFAPAEGAEVLERAAIGARQERILHWYIGAERSPRDLAAVVDAKADAGVKAGEGAEVSQGV